MQAETILLNRRYELAGQFKKDCTTRQWRKRTYPVLSIVAPVLTSQEGKIEFPGDPMCIYTALSYPIEQVIATKKAFYDNPGDFPRKQLGPYNDLVPAWGELPTGEYREEISSGHAITDFSKELNTDQLVFDPRIWNEESKNYFHTLLEQIRPKVVLISSTSPAHRYALEMANAAKEVQPETITILGGRHADSTIKLSPQTCRVEFSRSSVVNAIADGRTKPSIDFVISGEGYYALDYLMKTISLAMDIKTRKTPIDRIKALITARELSQIKGKAIIVAMGDKPETYIINGERTRLDLLPPPYKPFAIRARFPIFTNSKGEVLLTAHVNSAHSCPFRCLYCSESSKVVGQLIRTKDNASIIVKWLKEYINYGAEAAFFDDSIFCGGDYAKMVETAEAIARMKNEARIALRRAKGSERKILARTVDFQWGAQLTADIITTFHSPEKIKYLLERMHEGGCNYIYLGIESLAEDVAITLSKNVGNKTPWKDRIRKSFEILKREDIRGGGSVLFGLPGETSGTIEETISEVEKLVKDDIVYIVSPNIVVYHPGTELTKLDEAEETIDYISRITTGKPYVFFEEAFAGVISKRLTEEDIWYIHNQTKARWKKRRNSNRMQTLELPILREYFKETGK